MGGISLWPILVTHKKSKKLAAEIGENIYMDIAKWHLRLDDAHLHKTSGRTTLPHAE